VVVEEEEEEGLGGDENGPLRDFTTSLDRAVAGVAAADVVVAAADAAADVVDPVTVLGVGGLRSPPATLLLLLLTVLLPKALNRRRIDTEAVVAPLCCVGVGVGIEIVAGIVVLGRRRRGTLGRCSLVWIQQDQIKD
jgi:hypothetical protein